MKIAYISGSAIPSRTANSIHVMKMCQAFTQEGHSVELFAPQLKGLTVADNKLWDHYGISDSFPILWLSSSIGWLREHGYALHAVRAAQKRRAELIYTRLVTAAVLSILFGIPAICELHSLPTGRMGPHLLNYYLNARSRKRLVVISNALQRQLADLIPRAHGDLDVVVAHDGIDLERFVGLPMPVEARRLLSLKEAFTVVYAGHLYRGRGIELMLSLAERLPSVQFLFVGGEPSAVVAWQQEAAVRNLINAVFVGFVANAVLPRYLAAGDILAMPYQKHVSTSGNAGDTAKIMSPLKMFEYLAADRPIISSDLPVLREVLNDDVATMCHPDDVAQWELAIRKAIREPEWVRQKAKRGSLLVAKYTWRARVRRCLAGYIKP